MVLPDWSKDLNLNLHLPKSTQQISLGELSVGRSPKSTLATAPAVSHWGEVSLHLPTAHWHHNQVGLTKSSIKIRQTTTGENFYSARRIFWKPWESPLRPDKFSWPQMFTWSWKSLFGQEKFHSFGEFCLSKDDFKQSNKFTWFFNWYPNQLMYHLIFVLPRRTQYCPWLVCCIFNSAFSRIFVH